MPTKGVDTGDQRHRIGSVWDGVYRTLLAGIVLEVAEIRPYKKKRLRELAKTRRDLLQKLEKTGLIIAHWG